MAIGGGDGVEMDPISSAVQQEQGGVVFCEVSSEMKSAKERNR